MVAAGTGTRFGAPKQFAVLRGARVVHHAVATAGAVCDDVVVVLPADTEWNGPPVTAAVMGGATRSGSVRAGLAVLPDVTDVVVVHDAARPLAPPSLFRDVVQAVTEGSPAAVPVLAVTDTLKRIEGDRVVETVSREGLVAVQTPQAFQVEALRTAHEGEPDATDDAGLVEAAGYDVTVVPGDPRNLKITTTMDLELAMALMEGVEG